MERRKQVRYEIWFPVQVAADSVGALAMTHNVGTGGMLLAAAATLEPGQRVRVTFVVPTTSAEHTLEGRVLRVEQNPEDPEGTWPHRIAVQFDEIYEDLEATLSAAAERVSNLP